MFHQQIAWLCILYFPLMTSEMMRCHQSICPRWQQQVCVVSIAQHCNTSHHCTRIISRFFFYSGVSCQMISTELPALTLAATVLWHGRECFAVPTFRLNRWPLRHLIRVMRKHDLTNKDLPKGDMTSARPKKDLPTFLTYLPIYLPTARFDTSSSMIPLLVLDEI